MRGLAQGEQSTLADPRLQLVFRSGGYLADPVSGSVVVQDIRSHLTTPTTKVVAAALDATTQKVGTGRYAILTGSTTTWTAGTYRAVCTYVMTAGGPTYTQVVEFEILSAVDWPTGAGYVGYLSTRRAWEEPYAASTVAAATLHRHIAEQSGKLEFYTGRFFEPRYLKVKVSGQNAAKLILNNPIIALEDAYAVWQTTTGEDTYKFEQYLYKVYNRHLDGYAAEVDDRIYPHIELTDVDGDVVTVSSWAWPYGNQNIEVRGVFGYTDPEMDQNQGRVLVGRTPRDIERICGALIARAIEDPTLTALSTWSPGSLSSYRTRDQAVTFGSSGGGGGGGASEPTGDPLVDSLLVRYCRPMAFKAV